jgi:hypothetical protein
MKHLQKSWQLAAPKNMCRKFFFLTRKICAENFCVLKETFVCIKFPLYTENDIFFVFADDRIKPLLNQIFSTEKIRSMV